MTIRDYKATLNLPKTDFPMKADLPRREPQLLKEWQRENLYAQIHLKAKGKPKFILHDGPPYANGHIHMGHLLNKVLKDMVVKFETMRGKNAHYVPGWDCHGLPIELALLKEMGRSAKDEINRVDFRKKARKYASKYIAIQAKEFERLGVFGQWEKPYLTMSREYQAAIIRSFQKLYEKGYVYLGEKPIHWCTECVTALAEAELEYGEKTSTSVFVKFRLLEISSPDKFRKILDSLGARTKPIHVVIWTTTPWTLPANVAIALHPDLDYVIAEVGPSILIASEALLGQILWAMGENLHTQILATFKGSDLEGGECQHPFLDRNSKIVLADYVSQSEGSGCVHIAPGHGEEDYAVGLKYALPVLSPVDDHGRFTDGFPPAKGQHVFKANDFVVSLLKERGALLASSKVNHSYPHCWRCKNPVVFRSTKQWFLSVDHGQLRQKILRVIKNRNETEWIPDWGENRITAMIEGRHDWCLSRQRLWGVPIPVLYCDSCRQPLVSIPLMQKLGDQVEKEGADIWFEKSETEWIPAGTKCGKCGHPEFVKGKDILDVWFDSGVSHQAVLKRDPELEYPCAMYLEGSDQHRGWFQSAMITAVALDGKSPFKTVLTHGFVVDGEGKKMSKSGGNVTSPEKMMETLGADILRLWVASCDYAQDIRLSEEILSHSAQAYVKFRNTFRHMLANLSDFNYAEHQVPFEQMESVDRWAVGKCARLVASVQKSYEQYHFHEVYRDVYQFVVVDLSSFYFDVTKDRLYTAARHSQPRRSGQTALYHILNRLMRILAPIIPFTADEVWRTLKPEQAVPSVHLADWPDEGRQMVDEKLLGDWQDLWVVREQIMGALEDERSQGKIKAPLEAKVELEVDQSDLWQLLDRHKEKLRFYWIVSQVSLIRKKPSESSTVSIHLPFLDKQVSFGLRVSRADGKKCVRCWNYSTLVGTYDEHPELCERCLEAVTESSISS